MTKKHLILSFLCSLFLISNVCANTYTFTPENLIFRTNVFFYNGQSVQQNGATFEITGGNLVLDTATNISTMDFNFTLTNRIGKDATTYVPAGFQGTIRGQTGNNGINLNPNDLTNILSGNNFNLTLDFNNNTVEDWSLHGQAGIYCTARKCNNIIFPNNTSEPMGFGLQSLGNNSYVFNTDNFVANNAGLVLDNTWFQGTVKLSNSSQVPEPLTAVLLASGLIPGVIRRKKVMRS